MYNFSLRMRDKSFYSDLTSNSMSAATMQTIEPDNSIIGIPYFIRRADLASSKYLSDDSITIKCILWVCTDSPIIPNVPIPKPELLIPSSNLAVHFRQMLESEQGADVKFLIGDKTFSAHKCVLAARSHVFKDDFFGEKSDMSIDIGSIVVENVEAVTFQALLYFIYADLFPDSMDVITAQNLLVAADRYKLERLKQMCERRLCEEVTLDSLVTILILAEEHKCEQLRAVCMEFAIKKENYAALSLTDGFEELKKKCPTVLKELMEKGSK
ncbi:hypothetical protein LUZ60_002595 [Juncus effusus]|nr:hypothetical protein LUZ60_002595 [Juncus effusus]